MKGVAYVKYGSLAASTRVRLSQYVDYLRDAGIELEISSLLENKYLSSLFSGRRKPLADVVGSYISRVRRIGRDRGASSFYWVHCEAFPYMPGCVERLVTAAGRPVIYDFDDAIFHQYDMHPSALVRAVLGRKLEPLLRRSSLAICGNDYLRDYAARFCSRAETVPTVVDTSIYRPARQRDPSRPVTIGWIGSPSTWAYMRPLVPGLEALRAELGLRICVIGAGPHSDVPGSWENLAWSQDTEISLIQDMDIGIMPLPDEPWARGKCGYKLIQYMACGLPVVASPVGVNAEIVHHGTDGYHARSDADWAGAIGRLAADPALRLSMGSRGREKIVRSYSLQVHGPRLAQLVRDVVDEAQA